MIVNIITNVGFNYISGRDYFFENFCFSGGLWSSSFLFPIILECNSKTAAFLIIYNYELISLRIWPLISSTIILKSLLLFFLYFLPDLNQMLLDSSLKKC